MHQNHFFHQIQLSSSCLANQATCPPNNTLSRTFKEEIDKFREGHEACQSRPQANLCAKTMLYLKKKIICLHAEMSFKHPKPAFTSAQNPAFLLPLYRLMNLFYTKSDADQRKWALKTS